MIEHLAVVIPARNEGERLAACLRSVRVALLHLQADRGVSAQVVVVLDSCTDDSHEIASGFAEFLSVETDYANVGAARATGVARALDELGSAPNTTWIANTDADSTVPRGWLVEQLQLADAGHDLTLGSVEPLRSELTAGQLAAWELAHPLGAESGAVHGANLGVRASVYLEAGGFAALGEHEDVHLVAAVRERGAPIVSVAGTPVTTSGRSVGRTPGGFAGYLSALDRVAVS